MISHVALVLSCHSRANSSDGVIKWSAKEHMTMSIVVPSDDGTCSMPEFVGIEFLSSSDARLFKLS